LNGYKGGGVCIYVLNDIQFKIRDDLSVFLEGEFETMFIETAQKPTIVGEIYRIPNTSVKASIDHYDSIMSKLTGSKPVIIGTDQNVDFLKLETNPSTSELLNTYLSSSIIPTISKPTRITHTTAI
jgi:hypothetical protein